MSRNLRSKSRVPITKQLQAFRIGDNVRIDTDPSEHKGKPSTLKFNKRTGKITGKQGDAYKVTFKDRNKTKSLVISNRHLNKLLLQKEA
jgi:large subunit ribosomal protein L21e